MENSCPIFDPMIGLVAASCNGGCVMTAGFACECVTSPRTYTWNRRCGLTEQRSSSVRGALAERDRDGSKYQPQCIRACKI